MMTDVFSFVSKITELDGSDMWIVMKRRILLVEGDVPMKKSQVSRT